MVGFTLQEQQIEDDRHSVHSVHSIASTVATTTSLASRIRDLNIDFGDKLQEQAEEEEAELEQQKEEEQRGGSRASAPSPSSSAGGAHHHHLQHTQPGQSGRSSTELLSNGGVAAAAGADEDLGGVPHSLHLLHRDPPLQPLQVCCRLFERRSHPPLHLKRMTMSQVEDFRQHGYVVIDGLITREAAGRIKAEAARLVHKGLLQPVSQAHMGVMSPNNNSNSTCCGSSSMAAAAAASGVSNGCSSHSTSASTSSQSLSVLGSSPCRSASSCGPPPGFANGAAAVTAANSNNSSSRGAAAAAAGGIQQQQQQQQLRQQGSQQPQQQQQQQRWGELRMPLQLGQPPADTAVFAPLMAAMQELQEDLSEFVRLRSKGSAEYCLCQLPSGSSPVPRHKDAWPDDGGSSSSSNAGRQQGAEGGGGGSALSGTSPPTTQQQQQQQPLPAAAAAAPGHLGPPARRVSMFTFLNADWDKECGGVVRLWPPSASTTSATTASRVGGSSSVSGVPQGGPPSTTTSTAGATSAARRSPTSSDAGTTFSEISDCGSLRVAFLGSTTSSVIAEASAPDHDTYSLDGISVAESEAERQGFEWVECEGGEMALDIAPLAGRVLLVLSGAVEHALLPGSGGSTGCDTVFVRAWCC